MLNTGMKTSTIKLALKRKLDSWFESIQDTRVRELAKLNTIVSGGAIASMLLNEKVNDYDIYFRDRETTLAIAHYYVNLFNSRTEFTGGLTGRFNPYVEEKARLNVKGTSENRIMVKVGSAGVASESQTSYESLENIDEHHPDSFIGSLKTNPIEIAESLAETNRRRYRPVFFSENAVTLSDKMQLVIRFYGSPDQIHDNFDFAHAMNYYDYSQNRLVLHQDALECLLSKTLIYKGSLYPIASLFRIRKFISRGWRITAGQMLKIIWQLGEIDLKDPDVLKEQLIGVDQAYMHQLLRALESREKYQKIDATYIAKLVDEIFE